MPAILRDSCTKNDWLQTLDQHCIINNCHLFDLVGTLWNETLETSQVVKCTRSWRNRGVTDGWGIRRDGRSDGTSCAFLLILRQWRWYRETRSYSLVYKSWGFIEFYWTSKWCQLISCLRYKCRIFFFFNLHSLFQADFSNYSNWYKLLLSSIHVI